MQINQVKQVILLSQIVYCPSKGTTAHWSYLVAVTNKSYRLQRMLVHPTSLSFDHSFPNPVFLHLDTDNSLLPGAAFTLWDHPWSLPSKCQKYSSGVTTKNVPRHSLMFPGGIITTQPAENSCLRPGT